MGHFIFHYNSRISLWILIFTLYVPMETGMNTLQMRYKNLFTISP